MATRFGSTSENMIRIRLSPMIRAASTKSRRLTDRVWARSTRAPQAQPVMAMITPISSVFDRPAAAGS